MGAKVKFDGGASYVKADVAEAISSLIKTMEEADLQLQQAGVSDGRKLWGALHVVLKQLFEALAQRDELNILRVAAVEEKTGRKKSWIYAAVRAGTFPPPISIGGRASGWLSSEVDDWLEQQVHLSRGVERGAAE